MIVFPKTPEENLGLCKWVESRIKGFHAGDAQCVAVCTKDEILAVACYNNYYPNRDIEISFAADHPRWANKKCLAKIFAYPMDDLSVQRITARVHKSNSRCRKLLKAIGFVEEGKLRNAGGNNEPIFIYGLTREDYLKHYGIEKKATGTATGP